MVHVFLYVPNLIGYIRVIGAALSLTYALSEPWTFVWIYTFSMGLDAIDGVAARALKQSECGVHGVLLGGLVWAHSVYWP